jgi:hypothetical protein
MCHGEMPKKSAENNASFSFCGFLGKISLPSAVVCVPQKCRECCQVQQRENRQP